MIGTSVRVAFARSGSHHVLDARLVRDDNAARWRTCLVLSYDRPHNRGPPAVLVLDWHLKPRWIPHEWTRTDET